MKLVLTCVNVALIYLSTVNSLDIDVLNKFYQYEKDFNLKFESENERQYRLSVFADNLKEIELLNKKYPGASFGLTKFTTWTQDEFNKLLLPKTSTKMNKNLYPDSTVNKPLDLDVKNAPTYFDWRDKNVVTSVKDQGSCGSCWTFAATAAIESHHAIKTAELIDLSEEQILDCEWASLGCDGGLINIAYDYVKENGQLTAKAYPYTDNRTKYEKQVNKNRVFIDGHQILPHDEDKIAAYVAQHGPTAIGIVCPKAMMHYTGGILEVHDCLEQFDGLHAMLIVGYSNDFWIIKNSWSEKWGENGYVRFKRGINMCDMAIDADAPVIN